MAEELSVNYGGKLMTKGATLRKKTKMSWKYIKELINHLIKWFFSLNFGSEQGWVELIILFDVQPRQLQPL